jgi:hypothetical protein
MIAGLLVVVLLVAREVLRARSPEGNGARILGRMVVPVGLALGLLMALRIGELVVGNA